VEKNELRNLMLFVIESNNMKLLELVNEMNIDLDNDQKRKLIMQIEQNTKDCFFRIMEKMK
jgi:hypothetical protein